MGEQFLKAEYKSTIWTLIDSDHSSGPDDFVGQGAPFFIIFATSPNKDRWSRFHKSFSLKVIVMNPWTRDEIHQAYVMSYCVRCHAQSI
jgi:hypothetical protein